MTEPGHQRAPRFSIVVPAFQAEGTLRETLEAVAAQRYADWECVVVDDGSRDGTLSIAEAFAESDDRFRAIHQENGGTAAAYNTGVDAALGDFVVICSADDVLLPEHLAVVSDAIDAEPGFDIYSSNGYLWRPPDHREVVYRQGINEPTTSLHLTDVMRGCFFSVGATYRRRWFSAVGGYRVGVYGEDYDFWLRAMAAGARHRYLATPLSLHRLSATQKGADLGRVHRSDIALLEHLRQTAVLSVDEQVACEDGIRFRLARIEQLEHPRRPSVLARRIVKALLIATFGRRLTRGVTGAVKRWRAGRHVARRTARP